MLRVQAVVFVALLHAAPAAAQSRTSSIDQTKQQPQQSVPVSIGQIASSGNGKVGQRPTVSQILPNAQPMGRIESRIANRIQVRIANRIDRNYDPLGNAISPFALASDKIKTAAGAARR